jgi:V/A-type H+-transporting ATPase subunit C
LSQAKLYSNVLVKVGVERSHLLSKDKLKALTECKSLEEFASGLRETIYGEKLAKVTLPYTSKDFERVFRESLIEVNCKIAQNSPENVSPFLKAHLLKFEHENIKAILRAASVGLSYDEIISKIYMPVEEFLEKREIIANAAMGIHVKSVVDALRTTFYGPLLVTGLRKYEETGSTKFFDILLDRMFHENLGEAFKNLPKKEQKQAFFYVSMKTDSFNLSTILRAKILNYDPHWIRMATSRNFYNVPEQTIEALLMADDFESAFNIVKQSYYNKFFVKAEIPEETVSVAEKAFRKATLEHLKKTKIGDPFNIGTPIGFMVQKEVEAYNLTAISLGIEYGWKPDDILRLLLL